MEIIYLYDLLISVTILTRNCIYENKFAFLKEFHLANKTTCHGNSQHFLVRIMCSILQQQAPQSKVIAISLDMSQVKNTFFCFNLKKTQPNYITNIELKMLQTFMLSFFCSNYIYIYKYYNWSFNCKCKTYISIKIQQKCNKHTIKILG